MLKKFTDGVCAGLMIAIGCAVFLACDNKYVGSALFAVALLTICYLGYSLYTGKIGFLAISHTKDDFLTVFIGLAGNIVATSLFSYMGRIALPALGEKAETIVSAKLTLLPHETFIRAIFCGVLMYIAVATYKKSSSAFGIIYAVPAFILCGFEHSIADIGYFSYGAEFSLDAVIFIAIVILGNTVGGLILPTLSLIKEK